MQKDCASGSGGGEVAGRKGLVGGMQTCLTTTMNARLDDLLLRLNAENAQREKRVSFNAFGMQLRSLKRAAEPPSVDPTGTKRHKQREEFLVKLSSEAWVSQGLRRDIEIFLPDYVDWKTEGQDQEPRADRPSPRESQT